MVNSIFAPPNNSDTNLEHSLTKFWQIENDFSNLDLLTPIERECEEHFLSTIKRNDEGRFIVTLLMIRDGLQQLGESRHTALSRFNKLDRRFKYNDQLKHNYTQFMQEYLDLNHMLLVSENEINKVAYEFYLPHHPVFKETSSTTKLRVVFDGSCKSDSGISLNDILLVGSIVQSDLISILLKFRTFEYIFTADIIKMYRQILINDEQTSLQRILWRERDTQLICTYELKTLTYGTAFAAYIATRCLKYLAKINSDSFPLGSEAIINDFVDDLLTGANSIKALAKRDQIIAILKSGQFELSKWSANHTQLLNNLSHASSSRNNIIINKNAESRILGMQWIASKDTFRFTINIKSTYNKTAKRAILSEISQLFDPLGLLGPIILSAKLIIQKLWKSQIDWDSSVPMHIHTQWIQFRSQLHNLNELKINRFIVSASNTNDIQLHGFADASQSAYGACCYIRSRSTIGNYQVQLISKSRVAPMKTVSLPRLELYAAVLLARLQKKVISSINIPQIRSFLWTDSTITLSWIKASSRKWTTFVANRVGEVQRLTEVEDWHVDTKSNPTDKISREGSPSELMQSSLWWEDPDWLKLDHEKWPRSIVHCPITLPEQKANIFVIKEECTLLNDLISKYFKFQKLIRVLAYVFRFINNSKPCSEKNTALLTSKEYEHSLKFICKFIQKQQFGNDIREFKKSGSVLANSKLASLNPFLDKEDILRVGGLKNANLPYDSKHPILLPKNHILTRLIIHYEHIKNLHSGIKATIYAVRGQFWPISAKTTT